MSVFNLGVFFFLLGGVAGYFEHYALASTSFFISGFSLGMAYLFWWADQVAKELDGAHRKLLDALHKELKAVEEELKDKQ